VNGTKDYEEVVAPNVYFDRTHQIQAAKILPGEYYATTRDMALVTVLGSCVAACVRDRVRGIGGMNHFMLPENVDADRQVVSRSARYGDYAMEVLINQLMKLGARRADLEAKVFGGGAVMKVISSNVGARNASFVLDYLMTEGVRVVAQDLGDVFPRKVYFFPATGRALVRRLKTVHNDTIIERETRYRERLGESAIAGEVELF
jgi:chemotaxis protein CheD